METGKLQAHKQEEATAAQEGKCQEKETGRKKLLEYMEASPGADTDWIKLALQEKSKQSAVTTMMKQVQHKNATGRAKEKKSKKTATETRKEAPNKSKQSKKDQPPARKVQESTNMPKSTLKTIIKRCGCRHGDLSAIKGFNKTDARYYNRPNKFLEGRSCLDCKLTVANMEFNGHGLRAVVFYCDEGIKGFGAPDDDPLKRELTCDLILCPQCEAKRSIEFNKADSGQQGRGVKRCRQRSRAGN
jgi:hypothetical protein